MSKLRAFTDSMVSISSNITTTRCGPGSKCICNSNQCMDYNNCAIMLDIIIVTFKRAPCGAGRHMYSWNRANNTAVLARDVIVSFNFCGIAYNYSYNSNCYLLFGPPRQYNYATLVISHARTWVSIPYCTFSIFCSFCCLIVIIIIITMLLE